MPREIKTTLALDGEAKFKAGISAINKEMSVLNSEMKVVTSEYGKNGSSIKGLTEQSKVLSQQIEQQKVKQKALSGAVSDAQAAFDKAAAKAADMAAKFGENSKEAQLAAEAVSRADKTLQEYKIQSNNATAALNKMNDAQKQLKADTFNKLTEGLKSVTKAAGEAAAGVAKVAANAAASAVNATTKAFTAYTSAALAAGTAVFGLAASSAAAADDLNTMAKVTGLSTEQLQKMQYAAALIDVDVETVTGSLSKLTKNMYTASNGGKNASEAFSALGVSITDSSGGLRNNEDVFNEAITALGKIENSTQRDALAMQIFGKSAQELNPLILGGVEQLKQLGDSAESAGLILKQEALDSLNAFNDSIDILKANAAAAGNVIGGTFAGKFKVFTDLIGSTLPNITQGFAALFSGGDITAKAAMLADQLTALFSGITNNIAAGLPAMLEGFNGTILAVISSLVAQLPTVITTILPQLLEGFNSLISGLVAQIPVVLPLVIDGGISLFMGIIDSLNLVIEQLMPLFPDLIAKIGTTLTEQLPLIIEQGFNILIGVVDGITSAIPVLLQKVVTLIPVIIQSLSDGLPKILACGTSLIVELAKGLPIAIPALIKAIPQIQKAVIDALLNTNWLDVGVQILKGIAEGLVEGLKSINDVIKEVSDGVVNKFKSFFGIQSPSKLFKNEVGKYLASGLGAGFDDEMKNVSKNMTAAVPTNFDFDVTANTRSRTAGGVAGTTQYGSNIEAGGGQAVALGDTVINVPIYFDSEQLAEKTIRIANDKSISAGRSVIV